MIRHRPLDLTTWDHPTPDSERASSPFTMGWSRVLRRLQSEADHLAGVAPGMADVFVEVDLPPSGIRMDGALRADAPRRIASPAVAVTVHLPDGTPLRFPSDRYRDMGMTRYLPGWQSNVHAVDLTLEALRAADRHGVSAGEQYRGFAAIGATSSGVALGTGLTPGDALALLAKIAGGEDVEVAATAPHLVTPDEVSRLYRKAAQVCHPDSGSAPSAELFRQATQARDILLRLAR